MVVPQRKEGQPRRQVTVEGPGSKVSWMFARRWVSLEGSSSLAGVSAAGGGRTSSHHGHF